MSGPGVLAGTNPTALPGPPSFEDARGKRQRVRAAGLDPDYWYAVEYDAAVPVGTVKEVTFWGRSYALFRGTDGRLRALENRCAHRQLKLSLGNVDGCALTCAYHGWTYDGQGEVVHYAHDLFGRPRPEVRVRHYPVTSRHGLIWLFPGDPARATERSVPDIPELEGPRPWSRIDMDFTWRAHHSMIIDNVSDFSHAYLHRKYRPFWDAKLTRCEALGDTVSLSYDTTIGGGRFTGRFVDRRSVDTTSIDLDFVYPYQRSDTGGKIKHWCFVLPVSRTTTRVFFIFYFDSFTVPGLSRPLPRWVTGPLTKLAGRFAVRPLLRQDGMAVEAEQLGYEQHFTAPLVELNPAVHLFQDLVIRKWEEHLARQHPGRTAAAARRHSDSAAKEALTDAPGGQSSPAGG